MHGKLSFLSSVALQIYKHYKTNVSVNSESAVASVCCLYVIGACG